MTEDLNEYYEKKAKASQDLVACWCWLCAALVAIAVGVKVVKWLISF